MKTILFIVLPITCCFAQENFKGKIVTYYNKDWKSITDVKAASYFRTIEEVGSRYVVRNYFISGALQMESECKEYTPKLVRDGKHAVYYESGQIKEEAVFADNKKNGEFKSYYENGKVMEDITYAHGSAHYNHIFSPDGTDYLVNGTGTAPRSPDASNPTSFAEYLHHVQVGSYVIANSDTTYLLTEKMSEYPGGHQELGQLISKRMKYPARARRSGHEGTVLVSFTILKNGDVVNPEVVKGIHPDCDAEALRVMKTLGPWIPAEHHNKKVNAKFVLPFNFRLK